MRRLGLSEEQHRGSWACFRMAEQTSLDAVEVARDRVRTATVELCKQVNQGSSPDSPVIRMRQRGIYATLIPVLWGSCGADPHILGPKLAIQR